MNVWLDVAALAEAPPPPIPPNPPWLNVDVPEFAALELPLKPPPPIPPNGDPKPEFWLKVCAKKKKNKIVINFCYAKRYPNQDIC